MSCQKHLLLNLLVVAYLLTQSLPLAPFIFIIFQQLHCLYGGRNFLHNSSCISAWNIFFYHYFFQTFYILMFHRFLLETIHCFIFIVELLKVLMQWLRSFPIEINLYKFCVSHNSCFYLSHLFYAFPFSHFLYVLDIKSLF